MPSPELRCLECNRQFADLTADTEVERCGECGKFVVATPTLLTIPTASTKPTPGPEPSSTLELPVAEVIADESIPTVDKAKLADDLPLAQPVRPQESGGPQPKMVLPAWARRDEDDAAPPSATTARPASGLRPALPGRPAAVPARPRAEQPRSVEPEDDTPAAPTKKPRIGFALFVAFLFFLAFMAALGVLGYTIVRGLQMKKVITQSDQPRLTAKPSA